MIPDQDFIKKPKIPGPTKEEIRCLVMCKSQVSSKDVVVDVGCGTGGLTLEFARRAKTVYAMDKNPEAIKVTRLNLQKHHLEGNVHLLLGNAPQILDEVPDFDILMIGGSSGELPSIIKYGYQKLKDDGRIIVTSILLETRVEAIKAMSQLNLAVDVVDVSISKGRVLERGTMLEARNPVTIISAFK